MLIFQSSKPQTSRQQRHFERRKELEVAYKLKPQQMGEDELSWAISLEVDGQLIDTPWSFLQTVFQSVAYDYYDPKLH